MESLQDSIYFQLPYTYKKTFDFVALVWWVKKKFIFLHMPLLFFKQDIITR